MSRSGYIDEWDCDDNRIYLYRGAVEKAIRGKRGQAFLQELVAVMDAMPEKRLAGDEWIDGENVCALGAVAHHRGLRERFAALDPDDDSSPIKAAHMLGIAQSMAREIVSVNDECGPRSESDEARWARVRHWVQSELKTEDTVQKEPAP
jgi:hypothetical protein